MFPLGRVQLRETETSKTGRNSKMPHGDVYQHVYFISFYQQIFYGVKELQTLSLRIDVQTPQKLYSPSRVSRDDFRYKYIYCKYIYFSVHEIDITRTQIYIKCIYMVWIYISKIVYIYTLSIYITRIPNIHRGEKPRVVFPNTPLSLSLMPSV